MLLRYLPLSVRMRLRSEPYGVDVIQGSFAIISHEGCVVGVPLSHIELRFVPAHPEPLPLMTTQPAAGITLCKFCTAVILVQKGME